MFVTEFGGPYQISILRPISIAMLDLIYAGKFERQYLENGKGYKGNGFKAVRQLYLAIEAANICGLHCPYCRRGGAKNPTFNENVKIVANFLRPDQKPLRLQYHGRFSAYPYQVQVRWQKRCVPDFRSLVGRGSRTDPPKNFVPPLGKHFGGLPAFFSSSKVELRGI